MNGAECLVGTLINHGVDHVFTNPGTSELGLVAEIATTDQIRAVPVLFEGIAAGAADGYFRMTGRPAATMLHVGPGLANAWSALHNAAKAGSGIVNIVGQLSAAHLQFDSPLKSDLVALASSVSDVVRYPISAGRVGYDAQAIVNAAWLGKVATLLMANDVGWSGGANLVASPPSETRTGRLVLDPTAVRALMQGPRTLLLIGGKALDTDAQIEAAAISAATGCGLMIEWANARCERGGGLPSLERIPYQVDEAVRVLAAYDMIVLCGAAEPIAFFNYRNSTSRLAAPGTSVIDLQVGGGNLLAALRAARGELALQRPRPRRRYVSPDVVADTAPKSRDRLSELIATALPDGAIIVNESITSVTGLFAAAGSAVRHTWLDNRGGSIGFALPVSIGAAIAAPDRRVVALCGDGSTMYSVQSLWTIAREKLDITVLVFANRAYSILISELSRATGKPPTERAGAVLKLDNPAIDWRGLASSFGIASSLASSANDLQIALSSSFSTPGPHLIEIPT